MKTVIAKNRRLAQRRGRVRAKISGTAERPRLSVKVTNAHVWIQVIDDVSGKTLASYTDATNKDKMKKIDKAKIAGKTIAADLISKSIKAVVFDRNGKIYHGRVKAVAEGAREGGLDV